MPNTYSRSNKEALGNCFREMEKLRNQMHIANVIRAATALL